MHRVQGLKERALRALGKPAPYGPDVDLSPFSRGGRGLTFPANSSVIREVFDQAAKVGVDAAKGERAGTFLQVDRSPFLQVVEEKFRGKVEVMSTGEALKKYSWLEDYWWNAVPVDADKYTALAELRWDQGYFVRILPGAKVSLPIQSCLLISRNNFNQNVHNLIVAEEGSKAQIITGCTVHPNVDRALHVGVSEFYVKRGAELTFTMIHRWGENVHVRPRSAAIVEDGATFVSNYIYLGAVKSLQTFPTAFCEGENSRARFNALIFSSNSSHLDVGSKIWLRGENSRGESLTRVVAAGGSKVYARGVIVGESEGVKGHIECRGLLLSKNAEIHAIPELSAKTEGAELSHEAAVGKISRDEIEYLMARGLSEEEAASLIVRGFMDVEIFGLPEALEREVKRIVEATAAKAL